MTRAALGVQCYGFYMFIQMSLYLSTCVLRGFNNFTEQGTDDVKVVTKCWYTRINSTLHVKAAGYFVHVDKFKDSPYVH